MAISLALAGCGTDLPLPDFAPARASKERPSETAATAASESFQMQGRAIWDGQPSLGTGAWVAGGEVERTRQVRIRNMATGAATQGVLYPRERGHEEPAFTLSAPAARALDIPAGAVTEIRVTQLREDSETQSSEARTEARSMPKAEETRPVARPEGDS